MKKHKFLIVLCLFLAHNFLSSSVILAANPKRGIHPPDTDDAPVVRGQVQSTDKEMLSGVKVMVKRTAKTVLTDGNGHFAIQATENDVLIVKIPGFRTREVKVEKGGTFNIVVEEQTSLGMGKKDRVSKRFLRKRSLA